MQKDLLKLLDLSKEDIIKILNTADQLKYSQKHGLVHDYLRGKTLAMIFEKNSTRTRVSFETGMYQLGGPALFLSGKESQIGRGEPIEDTARVLARYCDGIMIRTFHQEEVESLASHSHIPVINGLTDFCHPCQVLADLMTVREHKATLAAAGADVVFTDVWASMGQEEERAVRAAAFAGYQVNDRLMTLTNPGCMVQHCLPAHRGEEITAEVFEAHAQEIFDEAENRLHAQKAVMYLLMCPDAK